MDIHSRAPGPYSNLSNLHDNKFELDGVTWNAMECLLQSFKTNDPIKIAHLQQCTGLQAKWFGKQLQPNMHQLWYGGGPMHRESIMYSMLLDRAYQALYDSNNTFKQALWMTRHVALTHNIGKTDTTKTILTNQEFLSRLTKLQQGYRLVL